MRRVHIVVWAVLITAAGVAIPAAIAPARTPSAAGSCLRHPQRPKCQTTTTGGPVLPYRAPGNTDSLPSVLKMDDEFSGTTLDTSAWSTGWLGSGITPPVQSQELACMDPAQVTVSGGQLHLKAIAKQETCGGKTRPYASGTINSAGKRPFTYGYFEAKVWIDEAQSKCANWSAWWLDGTHWPNDGEYDVMECLSGNNNSNWHGPEGGGSGHSVGHGGVRTGWHIFAGNWQPGVVATYYDGLKIGTYSSASNITSAPMFLILGEQIGPEGQYGGPMKIPSEMTVEWVRVWQ